MLSAQCELRVFWPIAFLMPQVVLVDFVRTTHELGGLEQMAMFVAPFTLTVLLAIHEWSASKKLVESEVWGPLLEECRFE